MKNKNNEFRRSADEQSEEATFADAIIVSGGAVDLALVKEIRDAHPKAYLVAADRGLEALDILEMTPDLIVGDFDSSGSELVDLYKKRGVRVRTFNPVKDDTDSEIAIRACIEKGAKHILMLGATGTRLDHVLGNICCLAMAHRLGADVMIRDAHNRIRLLESSVTYTFQKSDLFGNYVSFVPFGGAAEHVHLSGMKYSLTDGRLSGENSLGISNQVTEDVCEIYFETGRLLMMESRD